MPTIPIFSTFCEQNFLTNNLFHEVDISKNLENAELLREFVQNQANLWQTSVRFLQIKEGYKYYENRNDIIRQKRYIYGRHGEKVESEYLANNRLPHSFLKKLVNQKIGYLLSKPFVMVTQDEKINDILQNYLTSDFFREFKKAAEDAIIAGFGWIQAYYDNNGVLNFKCIPSIEIIPFWHEGSDIDLDLAIRVYTVSEVVGSEIFEVTKIQCFTENGILNYIIDETGAFKIDEKNPQETLSQVTNNGSSNLFWKKIPIIPLRYMKDGSMLLKFIKPLIDDYDKKTSELSNVLEEEPDKIKVVRDYDGTDKGEFIYNLSRYRTVFLRGSGEITTLDTSVTVEALETHLERLRRDIFEFGAGVDTQNKNLGNASGVALRFLYADLDMDMRDFGAELTNSLEFLAKFIFEDIKIKQNLTYDGPVNIIFNTDIAINESETISNLKNSVGLISSQTIVKNHPYVDDPQRELELIKEEENLADQKLAESLENSRPDEVLEE
jgi:SPP1 family phage portal protein